MGSTVYQGKLTTEEVLDREYMGCRKGIIAYAATPPRAGVQQEIYVAFRREDGRVFGGVVLVSRYGGCTEAKVLHEGTGPFYYRCPRSILELLDPPPNDYAKDWREECLKCRRPARVA